MAEIKSGKNIDRTPGQPSEEHEGSSGGFIDDYSRKFEERLGEVSAGGLFGVALGVMGLSAGLALLNERKGWASFVGNWVPSILFLTVYSKLIRIEGSLRDPSTHEPTVH